MAQAVVVLAFGAVGWMLPGTWLKGRVKRRQKETIRSLPDALDLVTTCVGAGLGLDAALARVAEKSTGPLADELSRMLREVAMGKLRREALTEMADRLGVEELTSTTHESHHMLFDNGVGLIENLTNLDTLGKRKTFFSVCTPIAVKGLEAFPVRVLGVLNYAQL